MVGRCWVVSVMKREQSIHTLLVLSLVLISVQISSGFSLQVVGRRLPSTRLVRKVLSMASYESSNHQKPQHVVIAGAGVIGTTTAYYLAKNYGIRSTLVDPTGKIAPAASGKAGGFLALDWNDHSPTGPLTHQSFALHQELADTLGADSIQYRRLTCAAISVNPYNSSRRPSGKKLQGIEWAQPDEKDTSASSVLGMRPLGTQETIAQVHPKKLCDRLWEETQKLVDGCALCQAKVLGAQHDDQGNLQAAELDNGTTLTADALLYSCGPWTANIMYGIKYHSAVVPTDRVLRQCVFFMGCGDPEVYVRPDSTAYCTGFPEPARIVTERPGEEEVRSDKIATILESVRDASGSSETGGALGNDPIVEQACYLPTTEDGIPVMGMLPEESAGGKGCFIATGHTCWGILLGPASGESMADLIATGQTKHVDLRAFRPSRYRNIEPVASAVSQ